MKAFSSFILLPSSLDSLPLLRPVLRPRALAPVNTQGIQRAADDVVAHARQVAHPAASDQYDAVLLKVVFFAGNVGGHFLAVAQADAGDLPKGRVGLLRGHRLDLQADAPLLRAGLEVLDLVDAAQRAAGLLDELVDRGHSSRSFGRHSCR